ncbi:MAG: hypothetical protein CM15mP74_36320 [Halieaceae bacterium]|nr:MAG: hypothetical protein CM15mP74_36320 [Halieaceae bacterium]
MPNVGQRCGDVLGQDGYSVGAVSHRPGTPSMIITGTVITEPPPAITLMKPPASPASTSTVISQSSQIKVRLAAAQGDKFLRRRGMDPDSAIKICLGCTHLQCNAEPLTNFTCIGTHHMRPSTRSDS